MRSKFGLWGGLALAILLAAAVAQQRNTKPQQQAKPQQEAKPKTGAGASSSEKAQPAQDEQKAQDSQADDGGNIDESQYVGTDACKDCHEEVGGNFAKNPHVKTLTNKRLDRQGCESCHGPGRSHSDAGDPANIINFGLMPRAEATKVCSTCHQFSPGKASPLHLQHAKASVGCLDCHTIHSAKVEEHLLKSDATKLCSTCHVKR